MSQPVHARSATRLEDTWDVTSVFPSDEAWEAAMEALGTEIASLARYQGQLASGPAMLVEWLDRAHDLRHRVSRVYLYASMLHDVETTAQEATARRDRAVAIYTLHACFIGDRICRARDLADWI